MSPIFAMLNTLQGNPDVAGSVLTLLIGIILALAAFAGIACAAGHLAYRVSFDRVDRECDLRDTYQAMMRVGVPYEVRLMLLQEEHGLSRQRVKDIALGKRLARAIVPGLVLVLSIGAGACGVLPAPSYQARPLVVCGAQHEAEQPAELEQPADSAGPIQPADSAEPDWAADPWADRALRLRAWRPGPTHPYWLTLDWASQMDHKPECRCRRRASRGLVVVRCVCSADSRRTAGR